MKALTITSPNNSIVEDVPEPVAGDNQVVVDVTRVGICGTDQEFFTGEMVYLNSNQAKYPVRIGHEWCGVVSQIGKGVNPKWLGQRVTGDTMLGCGTCYRCTSGRQHVCADRYEIGVRNGWPGACAEKLLVPERALHALPDSIDDAIGAASVHGVAGVWGTLVIGLWGVNGDVGIGLFNGGGASQLGSQAIGALAYGVWAVVLSFIILFTLKKTIGLRVSEEVEVAGLAKNGAPGLDVEMEQFVRMLKGDK